LCPLSIRSRYSGQAIKASGVQFADITEESGYAVVNPRIVRETFYRIKIYIVYKTMAFAERKRIQSVIFKHGRMGIN
jgi:hypothetical protein